METERFGIEYTIGPSKHDMNIMYSLMLVQAHRMVNNSGTVEPTLVFCEPTKTDKFNEIWYGNFRTWCVVPVVGHVTILRARILTCCQALVHCMISISTK